jgi:hypothetical protein
MFLDHVKTALETVGQVLPDEPLARGALAVAGGLFGLSTLIRRRKPERSRVNVDAPPGVDVSVHIEGRKQD